MDEQKGIVPVWFFVGLILFIYGVIILATGIYEYANPPVTSQLQALHGQLSWGFLHASLWWGVILTLFGGLYVILFRPKSAKPQQAS